MSTRVAVVGAGIAGAACARALAERGVDVTVLDRGRAPGGRMSAPVVHDRRVDLGAGYLTVKDDGFTAVVDDWTARGLARPWTDTFAAIGPDGRDDKAGPMRYAAPDGLRALVRDLLEGLPITQSAAVESLTALDHDAVVLAMPDPQARRLAPDAAAWVEFESVVAIAAGWYERRWAPLDAAFVNDDPDLAMIADDGSRRGDGAPVLVLHTTAERAAQHLDDPDAAAAPTLAALRRALELDVEPEWVRVHRWMFAKPTGTHGDEPFGLSEAGGRPLGLCTDSWCPSGSPRVESAWLSGHRLGAAMADRLQG